MNIRRKIELAKEKFEELKDEAHIRNPIRVRKEKARHAMLMEQIAANGGKMTDEMWNQTWFSEFIGKRYIDV